MGGSCSFADCPDERPGQCPGNHKRSLPNPAGPYPATADRVDQAARLARTPMRAVPKPWAHHLIDARQCGTEGPRPQSDHTRHNMPVNNTYT
jgi:hypothetical protein